MVAVILKIKSATAEVLWQGDGGTSEIRNVQNSVLSLGASNSHKGLWTKSTKDL